MVSVFRILCLCVSLLLPGTALAVPQRVVALTPSAAELVQALGGGAQLVGRSGDCGPELEKLPDVGRFDQPSLEKIVALAPDLCVAVSDGTPPALLQRLRSLGTPLILLDVRCFESLQGELMRLGEALGRKSEAADLCREIARRLDRTDARIANEVRRHRPSVMFLVQEKPFMAAAQGTFISRLIARAGGGCAVAAQGNVLYPVLSREAMATLRPEVVLVSAMSPGEAKDLPRRRPASTFPEAPELARSRIWLVDPDLYTRPSLKALDGLEQLVEILHPDE
ncbi:MAG: ABC transporter substrate-binding protein [Mailhella sp.]|nr:ABC transporter substrate-binding protein [Mailhella sp.]